MINSAEKVSPTSYFEKGGLLPDVFYEGFENRAQAKFITRLMQATKLPLGRIENIFYRPNTRGDENTLGSWYDRYNTLSVYKYLSEFPPIAQLGTLVHELAHANSPLRQANEKLFGSKEAAETVKDYATQVANQSVLTERFLNGYHKHLYNQYRQGEIDSHTFVEETWAIMVELRYSNPKHLAQVEQAHERKMSNLDTRRLKGGEKPDFVRLTSYKTPNGYDVTSGLDLALMQLTGSRSVNDLNNLTEGLKRSLPTYRTPLNSLISPELKREIQSGFNEFESYLNSRSPKLRETISRFTSYLESQGLTNIFN